MNSLICHIFIQTNILDRLQEIFSISRHWFEILKTAEIKNVCSGPEYKMQWLLINITGKMPDKHKTSEVCECIKLSAIKSVLRIYMYFICYCVSVLSLMKIFLHVYENVFILMLEDLTRVLERITGVDLNPVTWCPSTSKREKSRLLFWKSQGTDVCLVWNWFYTFNL